MKSSITLACAFAGAAYFGTVDARFGQEQGAANIIRTLDGQITVPAEQSGFIATIAGGSIQPLLGGSDPCDLADLMDDLIEFGDGLSAEDRESVVEVARRAMQVEKNFNPFTFDAASICLDATKPASAELRGVLPLVDPALDGAEEYNQQSTALLEQIINGEVDGVAQAEGKSIGQQMADEFGFTDIQGGGAAGAEQQQAGGAEQQQAGGAEEQQAGGAEQQQAGGAEQQQAGGAEEQQAGGAEEQQAGGAEEQQAGGAEEQQAGGAEQEQAGGAEQQQAGGAEQQQAGGAEQQQAGGSTISLGQCQEPPTIEFAAGLEGRAADEFTFRPANPNTFGGQNTALNPLIIVNFLCDRLNDRCQAEEARNRCEELLTEFQARGNVNGDGSIADEFNAAFGVQTNFAALNN